MASSPIHPAVPTPAPEPSPGSRTPTTRHRRRGGASLRAASVLAAAALALPALHPGQAAAAGPEQIVNGTFDAGMTAWTGYPNAGVVDGMGCVQVPAGTGAYGAALQQQVALQAGETYEFSFDIDSTPATDAFVRVVIQAGPDQGYAQFLPGTKFPISTTPEHQTLTFTAPMTYDHADVLFQQDVANDVAYQFCVDNVSLTGGATPKKYAPDTGPRVRVNQVGYLTSGPKEATLVTDATTAQPWQLLDSSGATVASGTSVPRGVDASSGLNVSTIDFGDYRGSGTGYTLVADGETSYPFAIEQSAYTGLRTDAMTLFYTQRSGIAISNTLEPGYGRAAGHVGVSPNQGDTNAVCLPLSDPGQKLYATPWTCSGTRDVSGGWYDAGDEGKYVVNGGIAVAQLMQEYERSLTSPYAAATLGDGSLAIPENHNGVPDILDEARWELEWMLKMQVPAGEKYAGMAYHKVGDADWTGLPLLPADDPQPRYIYRPSTAATLNLAAAAAQGARLFKPYDKAFAKRLLQAAKTAYAAAGANPTLYAPNDNGTLDPSPGSGAYADSSVDDEYYWAASELYLTTGSKAYLRDVLHSPQHYYPAFDEGGFSWGQVAAMARMDLATVPSALPDRARVQASVQKAADGYLATEAAQAFGTPYAPKGDYAWGSNSDVLNILEVVGTAYDLTGDHRYSDGVARGMDYVLGRNAINNSYVTGYGSHSSHNQHTRIYAHQLDPRLPNPPKGTLSGGANGTAATAGDPVAAAKLGGCVEQFCYIDDIGSYSTNELAINWNAPLAWVSSFLSDLGNAS